MKALCGGSLGGVALSDMVLLSLSMLVQETSMLHG